MKKGFTTGSCAAAAAKASARMLLGGDRVEEISILTPAGVEYRAKTEDIRMGTGRASCAVRKYSGDDPDVTANTLIYAEVTFADEKDHGVIIEAGEGIGMVTRPGLDQDVGMPAINSVPRRMIEAEVLDVMEFYQYEGALRVILSVPEGRALAERTFNPRLGIVGGISIIGTTGIIEPMSTRAILDTIRTELKQLYAEGHRIAVVSPGNYGLAFMREQYDYDLERAVKCSNYIGETIDMARELGYGKILIVGHVGKLIKLSGGIMNTHSAEADARMELMAAAAIRGGASLALADKILSCVNTEEACALLAEAGLLEKSFACVMERVAFYLARRGRGEIDAQCLIYANSFGLLGATGEAEAMLEESKKGGIH